MTGFMMIVHGVVCLTLIAVILMQSGRGGGLTESFSSAESMFGAQTNEFMIKATTVFASIFLVTCLGLAILNAQKGKSLMVNKTVTLPSGGTTEVPAAPAASDAPKAAPAAPEVK